MWRRADEARGTEGNAPVWGARAGATRSRAAQPARCSVARHAAHAAAAASVSAAVQPLWRVCTLRAGAGERALQRSNLRAAAGARAHR
jgi:hypothetical protein